MSSCLTKRCKSRAQLYYTIEALELRQIQQNISKPIYFRLALFDLFKTRGFTLEENKICRHDKIEGWHWIAIRLLHANSRLSQFTASVETTHKQSHCSYEVWYWYQNIPNSIITNTKIAKSSCSSWYFCGLTYNITICDIDFPNQNAAIIYRWANRVQKLLTTCQEIVAENLARVCLLSP